MQRLAKRLERLQTVDVHDALDTLLADVEPEAARFVREKVPARGALAPVEREVLASFFATLGMRLSSRLADLDVAEARRGREQLFAVLDGSR